MTATGRLTRAAVATAAPSPAPAPERRAPARRESPLRVAPKPGRRSLLSLLGTTALGLLFLAVLGIVVFQTLLVQTQSRLDELNGQIETQEHLADQHRLQLAELEAPGRIVDEATQRLGMVEPSEVLYLRHEPADDEAARLAPEEPAGVQ